MCGEKFCFRLAYLPDSGSPPRVRGKGQCGIPGENRPGITPACAGKRRKIKGRFGLYRDHPRVCGEKSNGPTKTCPPWGSPPRVRGKAFDCFPQTKNIRITPACAGKRTYENERETRNRDHPRVCGEKIVNPNSTNKLQGSPPRVRGKAKAAELAQGKLRITPACAGKRKSKRAKAGQRRDHPRVCGEKEKMTRQQLEKQGSPPRVRGKVYGVPEI